MDQPGFGPFRLDLRAERLWHGRNPVALRPKTFAVLAYLVGHPGELVTKEALLDAVWAGTAVTEDVARISVRELRRALGEDPSAPRLIETVRGRGYRFVATVGQAAASSDAGASDRTAPVPPTGIVGRDAELQQLQARLASALAGDRQVVLASGPPGIGKTALLDAFLEGFQRTGGQVAGVSLWVGRGDCHERFSEGEAFGPVLEALTEIARGPGGRQLTALLRRWAPTWLTQFPWLLAPEDRQAVAQSVAGTTTARMLREFSLWIEALPADAAVVLVLEDLHWADRSTMELLVALAEHRAPARLLVVGTYRPVEAIVSDHPVVRVEQALRRRWPSGSLPLELLPPEAVATYLARRFPGAAFSASLARRIHDLTDGNPLFMVTVVDDLVARGKLARGTDGWRLGPRFSQADLAIPDSLLETIREQLRGLDDEELDVLEAASVAGVTFPLQVVVAALEEDDIEPVEETCEALVRRRQFIAAAGESHWPDGTSEATYRFHHALHQKALSERIPPARRRRFHLRIGERLEAGFRERSAEVAAELAVHFASGGDASRAVRYHVQAAANAQRRFAEREAVLHFGRALEQLAALPDSPERVRQEIEIRLGLAGAAAAESTQGDPKMETHCAQVDELSKLLGTTPLLFSTLAGVYALHMSRARLREAGDVAARLVELSEGRLPDTGMLAHTAQGCALFHSGNLAHAREAFERALRVGDAPGPADDIDVWISNVGHLAMAHALLGNVEEALECAREVLSFAEGAPATTASALGAACGVYAVLGERTAVARLAERTLRIADELGLAMLQASGRIFRGWSRATAEGREGGGAGALQGYRDFTATGHIGKTSMGVLVVEALALEGRRAEAQALLEEVLAFVQSTGEGCRLADLQRLQGELRLALAAAGAAVRRGTGEAEAEGHLTRAIETARGQGARLAELRAARTLAPLLLRRGRSGEAGTLLSGVCRAFPDDADLPDLRAARAALGALPAG